MMQLIDRVVDGLYRLNEEEGDWLGWFVGKGVAHAGAQLTRIACGAT